MLVGNTEIGIQDMPSYQDFASNPTHLYQLKQERLQGLLNPQMSPQMMQQQPMQPTVTQASQSERWSNQ